MPLFFFHARYNSHLVLDTKGLFLSDLDAAVREARERTYWLQNCKYDKEVKENFWFEIHDEKNNLLVKLGFDEPV